MENERKKLALEIIDRLKKEYPEAGCTLDYNEAWKLLVSVRLAPLETRIERAVASGFPEEDVRARIARQITDADRIEASDVVFNNDGTPDELRNEVISWWNEYKNINPVANATGFYADAARPCRISSSPLFWPRRVPEYAWAKGGRI